MSMCVWREAEGRGWAWKWNKGLKYHLYKKVHKGSKIGGGRESRNSNISMGHFPEEKADSEELKMAVL